jgi:hypothetical protein
MKNKSNFLRGISMFIGISMSIEIILLALGYFIMLMLK